MPETIGIARVPASAPESVLRREAWSSAAVIEARPPAADSSVTETSRTRTLSPSASVERVSVGSVDQLTMSIVLLSLFVVLIMPKTKFPELRVLYLGQSRMRAKLRDLDHKHPKDRCPRECK